MSQETLPMRTSPQARRYHALREIERLTSEFGDWYEDVKTDQYETQLAAIRSEVVGAATLIHDELEGLKVDADPGDVYARCAGIERQITWLWRVWYYFRDKFSQRSDDRFAATLQAADEVVWSCYRPFFKAALSERVPQPAPLPYIEAEYSPFAVRRDQQQVLGSRSKEFDLVAGAFASLPVPILKLPIATVLNPWMLVFIGHEMGHFVQPLIAPDDAFVKSFRQSVEQAAGANADTERWGRWSVEIFADWYSVVTMGTWAIWAMAQFELAGNALFTKRRTEYPSPLVRLELMAALADAYGLPGATALAELGIAAPPAGAPPELEGDRAAATRVAAMIVALKECRELHQRVGLDPPDFAASGIVEQWASFLLGPSAQPVSNKPSSARRIAAGAACAWNNLVFVPEGLPDDERMKKLRTSACAAMKKAAMPGVRSSSAVDRIPEVTPGATAAPVGRVLKDLLAKAAREDEDDEDEQP